jgi:hypothetical protein
MVRVREPRSSMARVYAIARSATAKLRWLGCCTIARLASG